MTTELDLDINNYNINDIEKLFCFQPKSNYSPANVELREYEIREKLLSSGHINKKIKANIITFLKEAKQWLIDVKCTINTPTSIPKNYKLDLDNYPRSAVPTPKEDNIIEKQPTPFIYTQSSDYFAGTLNPIEKRINTKIVCIDSIFRQNYSKVKSTDFIYTLPTSINNVVSMQVIAAEIPHMWNSFSTLNQNNQMIIQINNVCITDDLKNLLDSSGILITPQPIVAPTDPSQIFTTNYQFTINIPDGNYLDSTFVAICNNIFLNQLVDDFGNKTSALQFLTVSVNSISTSTIIRANNALMDATTSYTPPCPYDPNNKFYSPNFSFTVNFNVAPEQHRPVYKNLGWMLGFRELSYTVNASNVCINYIDTNMGVVLYEGYLKSESSFGSNISNYTFLEIDDYHNNFPTDTIISTNNATSSYLGKNIIARITLTSGTNTTVNDNAGDRIFKKREYFGPVKIEKMRIRLLNRFGEVIDLNQNDYSIVLELKQLYNS